MSLSLFALGVVIGAVQLGLLGWIRDVPSVDQRYFNAMRQFPAAKYWYTLGELLNADTVMRQYVTAVDWSADMGQFYARFHPPCTLDSNGPQADSPNEAAAGYLHR